MLCTRIIFTDDIRSGVKLLSGFMRYLGIEHKTYDDEKCANIDEVISKTEKQIEALKEYKQSLIYEYVTGKKRV